MSITQRQYNHLQAMNIPLWVRKDITDKDESTGKNEHSAVEIVLEELIVDRAFQDILQCVGITGAEISYENCHLNLGLFNWQFTNNDSITFEQSLLSTPPIDMLIKTPQLKRQLWQIINEQNLVCQ